MAEPILVRLFSDYCGDLVIWAPDPTRSTTAAALLRARARG